MSLGRLVSALGVDRGKPDAAPETHLSRWLVALWQRNAAAHSLGRLVRVVCAECDGMKPHVICVVDFNWFGVRAGLGFYDICNDAFRPAFVDFWVWKWRMTFEFGRISGRWSRL